MAGCLLVLLQGCVTEGTPISVLGTPRFVPQSQPDSVNETGIRQDPNTGGIWLQWYRARGVAGYKVYRADTTDQSGAPIKFMLVGNVNASKVLNDTSMVDVTSIETGIRYYYCLKAYASDGSSSTPSDTINYKLLYRNNPSYPGGHRYPTVGITGLFFIWYDVMGGGYTVIRLKDITDIPPSTLWVTKRFQVLNSDPKRYFNFDSTATQQLISGHSYQWRVDRFDVDGTGRPYEGSTSPWSTFTVK